MPVPLIAIAIGYKLYEITKPATSKLMEEGVGKALESYGFKYDVESGINGLRDTIESGFKHQEAMLASIQTSVNAIGMVSVVGCALSAVNVYQLIKVQKSLNRIENKLENGFTDLKVFFADKMQEMLDIQQKQRLSQAYNIYSKGVDQVKTSLLIEDDLQRKLSFNNAIGLFNQALATYDNREDYENCNLPAKLRIYECCWAIKAATAETYCLQGEYAAALNIYDDLSKKIYMATEVLKEKMCPKDYFFLMSDLHWIHYNDMLMISEKKNFLSQAIKNKSYFFSNERNLISNDTEQTGDDLKGIYVPAAKLYLNCLLSLEQQSKVKIELAERHPDLSIEGLSVPQLCKLYVDAFDYPDTYQNSYISYQDVNQKFISLMENDFIKANDINYRASHLDQKIIDLHKICDSKNSTYEELHYFNYTLNEYSEKAISILIKSKKRISRIAGSVQLEIYGIASQLGISEKFSDRLNDMLMIYHKNKMGEYLKAHEQEIYEKYIKFIELGLSRINIDNLVIDFEKKLLLSEKEISENRAKCKEKFIDLREDILLKIAINKDFQEELLEQLFWKAQDVLQIDYKSATIFVENCKKAVQEYNDILLRVNNQGSTEDDKHLLARIQQINGLSDEVIQKIRNTKLSLFVFSYGVSI